VKLKLDENRGSRGVELFRRAGHDISTVAQQGLCSASDKRLLEVCLSEKRCLVTLDLEFGNPLIFRPEDYSGIALLRLPPSPTPHDLFDAVNTLIAGLARKEIEGRLWIIQRGRIREYQPEEGL
jgi:predicted nuclease of predicted toxin-antitoxin system